jgi:regulator of sirC expression with transglutaminase-like and TPR domain
MNKTYKQAVNLEIVVIKLSCPIPEDQKQNFDRWIIEKALQCGNGNYNDYFAYSDDVDEDIYCEFIVNFSY